MPPHPTQECTVLPCLPSDCCLTCLPPTILTGSRPSRPTYYLLLTTYYLLLTTYYLLLDLLALGDGVEAFHLLTAEHVEARLVRVGVRARVSALVRARVRLGVGVRVGAEG
jgi:hypothetical protein